MANTIIIIAISALVPVVIGGLFLSEIVRKATRRDKKYYLSVYGTIAAMVISTFLLYEVYKLVFKLLVKAYTTYVSVGIPATFIVIVIVWLVLFRRK